MNLSPRQEDLLQFVKECHADQVRKYDDEPYWNHPYRVAEMVSGLNIDGLIEIALCHDLFEDTECTASTLRDLLESIGYEYTESSMICIGVSDLTDVYTAEMYADNRETRKRWEANRLAVIKPDHQTVKYADFIDNTKSIVEHDPGFARVYLREKKDVLEIMTDGDVDLFIECCYYLHKSNLELK